MERTVYYREQKILDAIKILDSKKRTAFAGTLLTDEERAQIRAALEIGVFCAEQLASSYDPFSTLKGG